MSSKFTGEMRKEDFNFILHDNIQVCSCGTWQTGSRSVMTIFPYVAETELYSVLNICDLLMENGELQRQKD